jgi:hypothetical protein
VNKRLVTNEVIERILNEIDLKIKYVQINFNDKTWRKNVPSEPGWYWIKTDTPIEVLRRVKAPQKERKAHINIPETINETFGLQGIATTQRGNDNYVVYNGEASNLKARAREHERGHAKTYCLGLSNYETLSNKRWILGYVAASSCKVSPNNKLLRVAMEQAWRTINGWPILCKK